MSAGKNLLEAEVAEQPEVAERLIAARGAVAQVARRIAAAGAGPIVLVARGSSDNAAVYGRYLFEVRNRRLTSLATPSAVTLYGSGPRLAGCTVIAVSQSGAGEDVVEYVREARSQGALTVGIVNEPGSALAAAAELLLECRAGPERSVPATKTVCAQMTLLALVSDALAGEDGEAFAPLPEALARAAAATVDAQPLVSALAISVVGRGFAYPVALELALKLKETCRVHAEPFSAADFLHGPVALVGPEHPVVVVDVGGRSTQVAIESAAQARARRAEPLLVRAGELAPVDSSLGAVAIEARLPEWLAPIAALVLGQRLALSLAEAKGVDPSAPPGLRKVTSTR